MAIVLVACLMIAGLTAPSEWFALLTLGGMLGSLAVAVVLIFVRRGEARAWWLGFAVVGGGYMAFASGLWWDRYFAPRDFGWNPETKRPNLATSTILDHLHPHLQRDGRPGPLPNAIERLLVPPGDRPILDRLALPLGLDFPAPGYPSLDELGKYLGRASKDPAAGLPEGIPVDFDGQGLQDADRTEASTVNVNIIRSRTMPLGQTLSLILDQLSLVYRVREGRLIITSWSVDGEAIDLFRRIGHCDWAILAGCLGGWLCFWAWRLVDRWGAGRNCLGVSDDATPGDVGVDASR